MGGSAAPRLLHEAGLAGLVRRGSDHAFGERGGERLLPVSPELRAVLPDGGLRRGMTVGVVTGAAATGDHVAGAAAPAATSLLLALMCEASRDGRWCAVVGLPTLGVAAGVELGIAAERLALVPHPGPDWPTVVAALLDGFDIVAVAAPGRVTPGIASRLAARARGRGGVLVPYGPWPGADLTLEATDPLWYGIDAGRGRLRGRQLSVVARGRGAAAPPRVTHLWLPRPTDPYADQSHPTGPSAEVTRAAGMSVEPARPPGEPTPAVGLATVHPLPGPVLDREGHG